MVFDWNGLENAQNFLEESDLRGQMAATGVFGESKIHFLEVIETKTPKQPAT